MPSPDTSSANDTSRRFRVTEIPLPYIDNVKAVSITLSLNFLLTLLFRLDRYGAYDIVIDTVICAVLTAVVDVLIVWRGVRKAQDAGAVPDEVPVNKVMMLLPKNRLGLMAVFGAFFAVLCAGFNYSVFAWYGFESWTFGQFLLYKLVYSLILSERIVNLGILRLVQPDCKRPAVDPSAVKTQPIKNPLPSINGLQALFSNVSANLALQLFSNPYIGEYTVGGNRSIIAEGVIGSAVTCFIVVGIMAKTLDMARANGEFNVPPNRLLTFFPRNRWLFAFLCALVAGPIAAILFVGIFKFYGFSSWTFYEFFWIKMAYLTLLGKILVALTIRRFTQPDIGGRSSAL
jgi:hypothetical protein